MTRCWLKRVDTCPALSEAEARNADPDLRSFTDFDTQSGLDAVVSGRICSLIRPA